MVVVRTPPSYHHLPAGAWSRSRLDHTEYRPESAGVLSIDTLLIWNLHPFVSVPYDRNTLVILKGSLAHEMPALLCRESGWRCLLQSMRRAHEPAYAARVRGHQCDRSYAFRRRRGRSVAYPAPWTEPAATRPDVGRVRGHGAHFRECGLDHVQSAARAAHGQRRGDSRRPRRPGHQHDRRPGQRRRRGHPPRIGHPTVSRRPSDCCSRADRHIAGSGSALSARHHRRRSR